MDYEEKYKTALERARIWKDKSGMPKDKQGILDDIFPELAESENEDERIRKELIEHIKANCETSFVLFEKFSPDMILAWLEKQGKKELNTEDRCIIQDTISICGRARKKATSEIDYENATRCIDWLKSLKDRVQPQQKQDWSEEDKEYMDRIHKALYDYYPNIEAKGIYDWFCKQLTKLWIVWKQ